jgi:hypothetical protein
MSLIDKVKNKLQMAKGRGKEQAGRPTTPTSRHGVAATACRVAPSRPAST